MARSGVSSHRTAHGPSSLHRPRAPRKQQKEYKVVLEAVTEKKRKLHSVLTFQDQAPRGFGFIPVGFGEVTEWCKEQCRQRGRDVHIVSAKPKNGNPSRADPDKISSHVHRIGHHFPLDIIEPACKKFGYTFSPTNGLEKIETQSYGVDYFERRFADYYKKQQLSGHFGSETETKDYISGAVRELFPKIPEADLTSIVNHAFQEGTDRVGNAKELPLARRVQLAVVAHIRHTYTEYDSILKSGSWLEARQKAELPSLAKLKEWRDEEGQDSNELEETFREIIVIDDDDHETSPAADVDERELSMEIVSSRATARDLQPEPADRYRRYDPYVNRSPRRTIFLTRPPARPSYSAAPPGSYPAPQPSPAHFRMETRPPPPPPLIANEPWRFRPELAHLARPRPIDPSMREPVRAPRPVEVRGSDGRFYILRPVDEPQYAREQRVLSLAGDHYNRPLKRPFPLDSSPRESASRRTSPRRTSEQELVLPSVEQETARSPRGPAPYQYGPDRNHGSIGQFPQHTLSQDYLPPQHGPDMDYYRRQPMPQHGAVDLTSSPAKPIYSERDLRRSVHYPASAPSNQYVLAPSRIEYDREHDERYLPPHGGQYPSSRVVERVDRRLLR